MVSTARVKELLNRYKPLKSDRGPAEVVRTQKDVESILEEVLLHREQLQLSPKGK